MNLGTIRTLMLSVVFSSCVVGCVNTSPSDETDSEVPPDVAIDVLWTDGGTTNGADAAADAWVWETATCDATFIELPPDGETTMMIVGNWDRYVVYDDRRSPSTDKKQDIYLFDLQTCTEYQLTDAPGFQVGASMWESEIVWSNDHDTNEYSEFTVDTFDLSNASFGTLAGVETVGVPAFNGRYLVTYSSEGEISPTLYHPVLVDLWTMEEHIIAVSGQGAEHFSMSETHLAWIMSCATCGGVADVFYMDLSTKDIVHIESTSTGNQLHPSTWGDYIFWQDDREFGDWTIFVHQLSTGDTWKLIDDQISRGLAHLRGKLLTWGTCKYSPDCQTIGLDIVLYDVETGISRRVTPESGHFRPRFAHGDWLVYLRKMTENRYKIYAVDMKAAGLIDQGGSVIPE